MITPDQQEALSLKYSNQLLLLLPLSSGNIAVFNSARQLTGIIPVNTFWSDLQYIRQFWKPPTIHLSLSTLTQKSVNPDELGL